MKIIQFGLTGSIVVPDNFDMEQVQSVHRSKVEDNHRDYLQEIYNNELG